MSFILVPQDIPQIGIGLYARKSRTCEDEDLYYADKRFRVIDIIYSMADDDWKIRLIPDSRSWGDYEEEITLDEFKTKFERAKKNI